MTSSGGAGDRAATRPAIASRDDKGLALLRLERNLLALEHDLERVSVGRSREHLVRLHRVAQLEAMRRERRRVEAALREQAEQRWSRERVHQTGLDRHVLDPQLLDRKSTRLNSSHVKISYAVFCLKKKKK